MRQDPLTEATIDQLISNAVCESRTVEYKELLPGTSDSDKKEFLADATSFANTQGGVIYYGLRAEAGVPSSISGIAGDVDAAIQRLDSMLTYGVEPRIPGYHITPIPCRAGVVLAVSLSKSWASPHMVAFKGASRFYARNSAGKYQLDVGEIRSQFIGSESRAERLRRFRLDRIADISTGGTVLGQASAGVVVLHILPLQMFDNAFALESAVLERLAPLGLAPITMVSADYRHNFDGFLTYEYNKGSYVQAFRSGAIEAADTNLLQEREGKRQYIPSEAFERKLCAFFGRAIGVLRKLAVEPPFYVGLSLLNVRDYYMAVAMELRYAFPEQRYVDTANLIVPEVTMTSFDESAASVLKPAFDQIWAAAGWPRSMNYDEAGNWKLESK